MQILLSNKCEYIHLILLGKEVWTPSVSKHINVSFLIYTHTLQSIHSSDPMQCWQHTNIFMFWLQQKGSLMFVTFPRRMLNWINPLHENSYSINSLDNNLLTCNSFSYIQGDSLIHHLRSVFILNIFLVLTIMI